MTGPGDRLDMAVVESMASSVERLTLATEAISEMQAAQLAKLTRTMRYVIIGLVLDLLLTTGGGWLFHQVTRNSQTIGATQAQLRDRQADTKAGTCAIYELFLASYNPKGRTALEDPAAYEHNFTRLEAGAKVIGCGNTVRGR